MSQPKPPLLSVVVPIYNVGSYLAPCLDSILAASLTDLEVICVDDGSTDRSGEIADIYAQDDPRVTVLHVPNGGLGSARNVGAARATGRYLAFADSDDRIPRLAYQQLCGSLESSGSDFASGRARRFTDSTSWSSGLQRTAIPSAARRTHISRQPSLVYDTTAWNKVFRRSFWDEHGLSFPTGVLYEDIPVMIPAHVLAKTVDLLTAEVYDWRDRGDESDSITQSRAELKNVHDRLSALEQVNEFLIAHAPKKVVRAHDRKVLSLDMPLYVAALDSVSEEYVTYFVDHMQRFLSHVPTEALASLDPWDRVAYELLRRGRRDDVVDLVRQRKQVRSTYAVERRGRRTYATLPHFRDESAGVPDFAYDVTRTLTARAVVDKISVDGGLLVLSGYALVNKIGLDRPWDAVRYLEFTSGKAARLRWAVRPRRRPEATAEFGTPDAGYGYAGFSARVPLKRIAALTSDGFVNVTVGYVSLGLRRRIPATLQPRSDLDLAATVELDGGRYLNVYAGSERALRVAVRTRPPLATRVGFADGHVEVTVDDPVAVPGARLSLEAGDAAIRGELGADAGSAVLRARIPIVDFALRAAHDAQSVWRATIEPPAGEDGPKRPLLTIPNFVDETFQEPAGKRELAARVGAGGRLLLTDRQATITIDRISWDGGTLVVGLVPPRTHSADIRYFLEASARDPLDPVSTEMDGARVTVRFRIFTPGRDLSVAPGTWSLRALEGGGTDPDKIPFEVERTAAESSSELIAGQVRVQVVATRRVLRVRVRSGRVTEAGERNQALLTARYSTRVARRPLSDAILLQAWSGKQFSCSPRAIYEELSRRGHADDTIWLRRATDVEMPSDVRSVLLGSHEYWETLSTARTVVTNDAMPREFVKRPGSTYLQTWHGTPLKRIGFDIENVQFGDGTYLERFAADVAKWDYLVSPNPYSSEIFRRAFRYDGKILETGYPRNDVFYAPDVAEQQARVRERLGIRPGQRVVLWAPTWRDNQRDGAGRYRLSLPFGFGTWNSVLQPDDVLLFRGHQLLLTTMGRVSDSSDRLRNVTAYPDIQELYLAADVLITDYSSVSYDFANTRKPMIFYSWDLATYRDQLRGFYVDYEAEVPGPLVTRVDELRDTLADLPAAVAATSDRYAAFVAKYCALEDGHASKRVVDALLSS